MTKIISLKEYKEQRFKQSEAMYSSNPLWFNYINEGIKALALRDKDTILKNIEYNYYKNYLDYIHFNDIDKNSYSIKNYLSENINIHEPFSIWHGIEFLDEWNYSYISKNDCSNISDIIVRVSLSNSLKLHNGIIEPIKIAKQYNWESIIVAT